MMFHEIPVEDIRKYTSQQLQLSFNLCQKLISKHEYQALVESRV